MNLNLELKRLLAVTLGTVLFAIGVSYFLTPANLIPSGLIGFASLAQHGLNTLGIQMNLAVYVIVFNIPVMALGIIGISRKFVTYSVYSIVLQSILIGILEELTFTPLDDILAASVLGGLVVGLGAAIALKAGASLGGIDIISQYLALKLQMGVGYIGLIANAVILVISLVIYDPEIAFYTLMSFVATNLLIDRLHTAYKRVRLDILTDQGEAVKTALLANVVRGVTMIDGKGAYTGMHRSILWMITQNHEVYDIKRIVTEIDPKAYMTMTPIKHLNGFFTKVIIK